MAKKLSKPTGGMGPAAKMGPLRELISFCLDQFEDGEIKGFKMIIDTGKDPMEEIALGTLAG